MYLSDGRVSLREFRVEDIPLKIEWINDARNNQFLHYDLPLEFEKTVRWFYGRNLEERLDCIIEYDKKPVGVIGLLGIDRKNRKAEYYITIGCQEYKRSGIAKKASQLILKYAFNTLDLHKVYLNVDSNNTAACLLYEKIGMICEGEFIADIYKKGKFIDRKRYAIMSDSFNI